jgi:hypothetical protein
MASAERIHRPRPRDERHGRRRLPDVVHELHHRKQPRFRRPVPRAGAERTLRYTDRFDDPNLPGEMQTTVSLRAVSCGTELDIVQEGLPGMIPLEACYVGWQESLALLAKLVEAEIRE